MAIDNLPLFNAVNDEEVKHPAHPGHGHPSHPFDCAPHGRPFTRQEAHYEILHRVEACVAEVHRFEERVRFEVEKFMQSTNTENQAFKEALQASYNCFLETVQNEVNNFEQSMRNDYDLLRGDLDQRFADFETSIQNAVDSMVNNAIVTHEALMDDLREMRTSLNSSYAQFVNNVHNTMKTYQDSVNAMIGDQTAAIQQFGEHMVEHLPEEVRRLFAESLANGTLNTLMLDWFGTEHRFRGAAIFEERFNIDDPQVGDYFFCTDNECFYMYGQVYNEYIEGAPNAFMWFNVGTGVLAINQLQTAVGALNYSHALYFENIRMELDTLNKTIKLIRPSAKHSVIFTPSRWVTLMEDKTFNYSDIQVENTQGGTFAFVYNTSAEAIRVHKMMDSAITNIFNGDDIVLAGVWFNADMSLNKVVFSDVNEFYIDGREYKSNTGIHEVVGCSGKLTINIDTVNNTLVCGSYGHVFGYYLDGKTFSRYVSAHETPVEIAATSSTYALVIDRDNKAQLRRQIYAGHNPFMNGDMIVGYAYITYENGVHALDTFACRTQMERHIYFNGNSAFNHASVKHNDLHKIFKRVCCCGDSYMSGHMVLPNGTTVETNEDFSWVGFMQRETGNEWINCGQSGANVLTWQTAERGYAKAEAAGKVQAYVIGLMLNDCANGTDRYVSIGTAADIGTTQLTYYGGMSKIIRSLNTINPLAKIFVLTTPRTDAAIEPYNQAVVDIVNAYKDVYPVHCLDLREYKELFNTEAIKNDVRAGHYTSIGYEIFAENIAHVMAEYIGNNVSEFADVPSIECDMPFVSYADKTLRITK